MKLNSFDFSNIWGLRIGTNLGAYFLTCQAIDALQKAQNYSKSSTLKEALKVLFNYTLLVAALHCVALLQCLIGSNLTYFLNIT